MNFKKVLFILLSLLIIIFLSIIYLSSSLSVNKEYTFKTPKNDKEFFKIFSRDHVVLEINNSNSIFPKKLELNRMYTCIFNKKNSTLVHSSPLYHNNRESVTGNPMTKEILNIKPNEYIFVNYTRSSSSNLDDKNNLTYVSDQEVVFNYNNNYRVEYWEFDTSKFKNYNPDNIAEGICKKNINANKIYPN